MIHEPILFLARGVNNPEYDVEGKIVSEAVRKVPTRAGKAWSMQPFHPAILGVQESLRHSYMPNYDADVGAILDVYFQMDKGHAGTRFVYYWTATTRRSPCASLGGTLLTRDSH